jgi:signal transduction histidine kinase
LEGQNGPLVYAAIRDCTQRKQAEEALRKLNDALEQRVAERTAALAAANEELAQRNRENEMFVYTVSHDLRSPLVNLQGFSNELRETSQELRKILAEKELPAEIKQPAVALIDGQMTEAIHFVQSAVLRLAGIIDALLRLSRAGRLEYRYQRVDLDPVVGRIVDSLALTLAERQAVVRATPLPPVWGDATAVEQVFANLIGNALNYLDPLRPGVIEVGAVRAGDREAVQAPRGLVTVYDRDNGLGIPERCKDKVFRAFQRIHPHAAPGEGMGLSIVQRIVERHCGKVWFESKEGAGTTFFVALPPAEVREPNRVVGSANSLELTCAVG